MRTAFADSYYFIALLNPRDAGHRDAVAISPGRWQRLVTADWVLIEVGNALSNPLLRGKFAQLVDSLRARTNVTIVSSSPLLFEQALRLYRERPDKHWSLSDCLSFVAMAELSIVDALTADAHFEQAGFTPLLMPQ